MNCNDNQLTNLPAIPNSLQELHCHDNPLTNLPKLPFKLHLYYYEAWSLKSPSNGTLQLQRYLKEENERGFRREIKEFMKSIIERLDKMEEEIKLLPCRGEWYKQAEQSYNERTKNN